MDLQLDDHGRSPPESVDALEPDELSVWIRDRLHDRDYRVSDAPKQDIGQYYLVGAIYDSLALSTQADVRRALKRFLLELERAEGEWAGRPAHTLLLLTKEVGEGELAPPIRRMAENERFLPEDEELHARLLQTLVFLGEKMTPEFWKAQVEQNPSRFGAYAFAGLRMHSLPNAFGFVLNKVDLDDEDLQTRLTTEIRGLLAAPGYTREQLREQILSSRDFIPEDGYALIRRALPELDLEEMENEGTEGDVSPFSEARQFFGPNGDLSPNESLQPAPA